MKSNISRRDFLKGSAMGALGLAAAGLVSPVSAMAEEKKESFEKTVNWDAEYDAVVIGFGGAGASVAITAADAGAKVLLLEKAPEGKAGGNSVICMQWICGTSDKAETVKYIKALRGKYTTPSDEMIELYVDGMAENFDWIKSLGAEDPQCSTTANSGAGGIFLLHAVHRGGQHGHERDGLRWRRRGLSPA